MIMAFLDIFPKQPTLPCQGNLDIQHWLTALLCFFWKGRAKRNLWMAASGTQLIIFPSLILPISLLSFLFFLDCKFHSRWKGPKYNCRICTEKAACVEGKKLYRNRGIPLGSAKLNTGGVSACICIQNMHTHVHVCTDAI